jgi:hypothetical protein
MGTGRVGLRRILNPSVWPAGRGVALSSVRCFSAHLHPLGRCGNRFRSRKRADPLRGAVTWNPIPRYDPQVSGLILPARSFSLSHRAGTPP